MRRTHTQQRLKWEQEKRFEILATSKRLLIIIIIFVLIFFSVLFLLPQLEVINNF